MVEYASFHLVLLKHKIDSLFHVLLVQLNPQLSMVHADHCPDSYNVRSFQLYGQEVVDRPGKTQVNVNLNFALEMPTVKADMLDSYQYAVLRNQALANDGLQPVYSPDDITAFADGTGIDNDWRKIFLKDMRTSQRYNIELNGGNERVRYYVNGGYARTEGMYKVDWKEKYNPANFENRFTLVSNIDVDLFSFMTAFLNTNIRPPIR